MWHDTTAADVEMISLRCATGKKGARSEEHEEYEARVKKAKDGPRGNDLLGRKVPEVRMRSKQRGRRS